MHKIIFKRLTLSFCIISAICAGCSGKISLNVIVKDKFFLELHVKGTKGWLKWYLSSRDEGSTETVKIDVTRFIKKKTSEDSETFILYFPDVPDRYNTNGWIRDLSRNYLIKVSVRDSTGKSASTDWFRLNVFKKMFLVTEKKLTFCKPEYENGVEIFWVSHKKGDRKWYLNKSRLNNYLVSSPLMKSPLPDTASFYSSFHEITNPFCTGKYGIVFFERDKNGMWRMMSYNGKRVGALNAHFDFQPLHLLIKDLNQDGQEEIVASSHKYDGNRGIIAIYSEKEKRLIFHLEGEKRGDELGYFTAYCNNYLLVSAPGYYNSRGVVYVLKGGTQLVTRLNPEGNGGRFGHSILCYDCGQKNCLMIGAPLENGGNGGNYFFSSNFLLNAHITSHDNAHLGWSALYFDYRLSPTGKFIVFSAPNFPSGRGKLKITDGISNPKTLVNGPEGWFIGRSISAYDIDNDGLPEIIVEGEKGYVVLF